MQDQGKLDEAVRCHRQAIAGCQRRIADQATVRRSTQQSGQGAGQLALILGSRLPEDDLTAMRQLLSEPDVGGDSRIALEFGLARVLDAGGHYDEAAEHLRQANALRCADLRARNQEYEPAELSGLCRRR